jgi:hypothetical protein
MMSWNEGRLWFQIANEATFRHRQGLTILFTIVANLFGVSIV